MVVRYAQASLASSIDELFAALALGRSSRSKLRSPAEALDPAGRVRMLAAIAARYDEPGFMAPPEIFFGQAGTAGPVHEQRVRAIGRLGEVVDLEWSSGYRVLSSEPDVRATYRACAANDRACARWWRHGDRPRPTAILLHGYLGGVYSVEERAWPMRWMFERLGLDLVLPVLPFHGTRNLRGRRPLFPSTDPRINVEGFRQAIWDLTTLRRHLEARSVPAVGLMGMSLGGYTTALAVTADPNIAFAVPVIPLASIADFARDAGRLVGSPEEQRAQHDAIEQAHRPVSPLARPSRVEPRRIRILAGEADRITPTAHARRLATHFAAPLSTFPGGHLLQFGRGDGFREIARMLRGLELLERR